MAHLSPKVTTILGRVTISRQILGYSKTEDPLSHHSSVYGLVHRSIESGQWHTRVWVKITDLNLSTFFFLTMFCGRVASSAIENTIGH